MKKTMLIISVAALAVALFASVALAQGRRGRGQGPPEDGESCRGATCIIDELGLSEEQVTAIESLREQHLAQLEVLRAEAQAASQELRALAEDEAATIDDVEILEDALAQAHRAIRSERRFFRTQVYDMLTPEQQAQVPNAWRLGLDRGLGGHGRGNRHARMGQGRGQGRGYGHGRHGRGQGQGRGRGWSEGQETFDQSE